MSTLKQYFRGMRVEHFWMKHNFGQFVRDNIVTKEKKMSHHRAIYTGKNLIKLHLKLWKISYFGHTHTHTPSLTTLSLKRLLRIGGGSVPLARRMPVSMASLVCSDSLKPFRNSRSYTGNDTQADRDEDDNNMMLWLQQASSLGIRNQEIFWYRLRMLGASMPS